MHKTKETKKEKYTSRNWMIMSPNGKTTGVVCFNKSISFSDMEKHFPGWKMTALFKSEREIAERKASKPPKDS